MLDPLSVAALALAVFEQLIKLGERTTEVISDIRSFDKDVQQMRDKTRHQIWRTKSLQLIFRESQIYGGQNLIQQFDDDAQGQIHSYLDELYRIMERALRFLTRAAEASSISHPTGDSKLSPSEVTPVCSQSMSEQNKPSSPTSSGFRTSASMSSLHLLRWSLRDKKELTVTIAHFAEVNDQLLEMVRFLSLASTIGVDLRHLEHLRTDQDSLKLGLHDDASLALTVSDAEMNNESFELAETCSMILEEARAIEDRFAVFNWNGSHMLRESCVCLQGSEPDLDLQTRSRINQLTKLLHQPKERLFCIPLCHGWSYSPRKRQITYLFRLPSGLSFEPKSLLRLLKDPKAQPPLGMKFHIAHSLARSIAQLHMVKWVHESFRSENILFFAPQAKDANDTAYADESEKVDLNQPWIFGFEFSRPDSFFSAGFIDTCPDRDVYRHPERQGQPLTTFKKIDDIYALGIVLLEIGIWRPAVTLERNKFAHARDSQGRPCGITQHLTKHAQKHLENPMGSKYREIVLKCISGNFGVANDTKEDLKLQQAFRLQVVDVLRKIVETL